MAFSTQREILNFPFHNEDPPVPDRKRSDCQLKRYESCTDARAWSMNPKVSAQFLLDVLHKSRFRRKLSRPSDLLTRAYLRHLDTEDLIDYVVSLMTDLEKIKSKVRLMEEGHPTSGSSSKQTKILISVRAIRCYKILFITLLVMFFILLILNLSKISCFWSRSEKKLVK